MTADLAVFGARIRTLDPARPKATALAVLDGVIVAVGEDDEVRAVCDASTTTLDGTGAVITPGITDGHQHLFQGAEMAQGIDFDRVPTLEEVRSALAVERRRLGAGAWVRGFAFEYSTLGDEPYHHELLDAAAGDGPMLIYSLDVHTVFVNAEALRIAGVDGPRRFPDGASIVCDDDDRPTGELREISACQVVLDHAPRPSHEERLGWYAEVIAQQNAVGITAIHQMNGGPETVDLLAELEERELLGLRVVQHYLIQPGEDPSLIDELTRGPVRRGRRWSAEAAKFVLDGVIETGTAWLEAPDTHGAGTEPLWPDIDAYRRVVRRFHDAGFRIATHAIGDRAVRVALDAYSGLAGGHGRHRIEHVETAPPETIARFAPQGITASMQPMHLRWLKPDLSDPWSERLGFQRCAHAHPSGDLSAAGARIVLGSDWPVAPFDPRTGFFAAQLRRAPDMPDKEAIGATRPLTATETLAGYTTNSAQIAGDGDVAGQLRPGYRADFVLWGDDLAQCAPQDVVDVPVFATIVDGEVVHQAAGR